MADEMKNSTTEDPQPWTVKRVSKWVAVILLSLLIIILILGLIPAPTDGLESVSNPADSYEEAIERFQEYADEENAIVNEAGHSLLMTHDGPTEKVYVLIHGITNSPRQFVELGEVLHERGYNVLILRMPHHGLLSHDVAELKNLKADELRAYGDEVIDIAAGLGEEITVIGISGGGAVTSWIGQNRDEVQRVVPLSPFFGVPAVPSFLNTFLMNLASRVPNVDLKNPTEEERAWVYQGEATRGVAEFLRLGRGLFNDAEISMPAVSEIYFVTTAVDDTADNDYTVELAEIWQRSGADVSSFEFDESFDIPHNSIDPAADPAKKALVYAKILELLGEEPLPLSE